MTPLERAARALHKDYIESRIRMGVNPNDLPSWDDLGADGEFSFYTPARAVIEAIREPSAEMVAAGDATDQMASVNGPHADTPPLLVWPAMIDALLRE
ncbi:hypothetical protein [Sphingomonas sp. 1P08PE]|uniref:hypothetical protein n=1 Tax=Sphingomonas sp. 1P08PE TaxID=554122 RepID=UPI0039A3320F